MLASRSEIASCQSWPFSAAVTSAPKVTTLRQKMAASRGCFVVTLISAFEWHLLQWKDLPFPEVRHNHESQWLCLNNSTSPPKNWSLTRRWASLGCNPAAQAVTAILRMCLTGSNQGSREQSYEILMAPHLIHNKTDGCPSLQWLRLSTCKRLHLKVCKADSHCWASPQFALDLRRN